MLYDLSFNDSDNDSGKSEVIISKYENDDDDDDEYTCPTKRKHIKSKVPVNLVTSTRASTRKAAKICKQLAPHGINIPTPSQAGVYKSVFKEASKLKKEMSSLDTEQWSLHFDEKSLKENKYQVAVLKNERMEVKLAALCLKDGKAETITNGISKVLEEYNLWSAVKMIVADTTSKKNDAG